MSQFGAPKTKKFKIGTSEVRLGPMSRANKLTPADSIGLLDTVTVEITQESVDLEGGFPKTLVDTAITKQTGQVTAAMREYSRRNINIMLGNGVGAVEPVDFSTTIASPVLKDATSFPVFAGDGANLEEGDILVVYPEAMPDRVSCVRVAAVATDVVTLDPGTPLLFDYAGGTKVFVSHAVPIGGVSTTAYMSCEVFQQERATGRPVGFKFWKVAISSGMNMQQGTEDFASSDLTLKILLPASAEFDLVDSPLYHLRNIIPEHPQGMYLGGADN